MVDSIKNQTAPQPPAPKQPNNSALRESFKNLSSGLSVSEALRDAPAVVHVQGARGSGQVGKIVNGLQDAVKSSNETLKALEEVAANVKGEGEPSVVREFADDLEELKSDIVNLLETLRRRAGAAEVLSENMEAADVRLEDLAKAREKAETMQFDSEKALNAHSGIDIRRVSELLAE